MGRACPVRAVIPVPVSIPWEEARVHLVLLVRRPTKVTVSSGVIVDQYAVNVYR
jgi:hypothetical protein